MQNNNTIILTQNKVLFDLGQTVMTIGAREALEESNQSANEFLARHQTGDWGFVCADDRRENDFSVKEGFGFFLPIKLRREKNYGLLRKRIEVQLQYYYLVNIRLKLNGKLQM
jgi:hypothetical protein